MIRGLLSAYGSYQTYYETWLLRSTPSNAIAWVGTIEGVLLIMGGIVTGPIYDRGYIYELLLVGTFLTVLGVMMTSLSTEYYQILLAQGFCVGLGSGILYTPSIALVASRFSKRRSLAICFATSGTAVGGIIYPIMFIQLQPLVGFAWMTRILGFITLAELIVALAIILPYVEPARSLMKRTTSNRAAHALPPRPLLELGAFKEPAYTAFCLALFFMWIAYWVPFFFIPSFGYYMIGASPTMSFYLLVITNAATLPGRLLTVFISERFGIPECLLAFTLASTILLFVWITINNLVTFIVWIVLLALFMAPLAVLVPAIVPQLCPSKETVGTRMGMAWTAAALGVLVGAPVSSTLGNLRKQDFWQAQVFIATSMLVGAGLMGFVLWEIRKKSRV